MTVKECIIEELYNNREEFISGEELAEKFHVSRAAVCKAVGQLKKEGYQIQAVTNRGYSLLKDNDVLSKEGIRAFLKDSKNDVILHVSKETGSTNNDAKISAANQNKTTEVFITEKQTAGRGRRGRNFLTFNGRGLYLSILIHPKTDSNDLVYVTTGACVGVRRAIKKATGKDTQIKWVNDLYYNGKKVCGILTEAVTDCETGQIGSLIIGIGINFSADKNDIPKELSETACALYEQDTSGHTRNELAAAVIKEVLAICTNLKDHSFLEEYKEASMILGKKINVIKTEGKKAGTAAAISDSGALIVRYEDGSIEELNTGEVTIRL